ncbi:HAD family hydrolase [Mycoplasma capricolum subsp. capricolum]|uniref:HAD family hydrolase n=1 Tax=Mycoplasma capricolum TaxID=2095 RepID=UPI003DA66B17
MYKIIAIDIDGTVYSRKHGVHELTKLALKKAREKGIKIVIATGRTISTTRLIAKKLDLLNTSIPFIGQNGGQVFSYETNGKVKIRYTKKFTNKQVNQIFNIIKQHKAHAFCYTLDENIAYKNKGISIFFWWMKKRSQRNVKVYKPNKKLESQITKYICFGKRENMRQMRKKVEDLGFSAFSFSYVTNAKENIEINPIGVNKGYGLEYVAKELNIKPEEILFFGDGENDLEAIKFAGTGVAMKNSKLEIVKNAADDVTSLTADQGGVGEYIFKHVLKEEIPKEFSIKK